MNYSSQKTKFQPSEGFVSKKNYQPNKQRRQRLCNVVLFLYTDHKHEGASTELNECVSIQQ